ncbi:hypothetical protein TrVE_jg10532 [Triparma verrucosa]|uniref:Uncharacterized protein n=1 Tax=Triparma verrucosa TaxID=1606542 RepID=A0A9W7FLU8_9STRA|nr:hypothetical protein TrVE_jg10532 [Triparma verrucosa]
MTYCKAIETVFEAIPSSILQIYALILAAERNLDAVVSILVSAATIAFTSSMISYDWDTSPEQRRKISFQYGYIPDKASSRAISSDYERKCFLNAREDQDDVKSDLLTDHPDVYHTWGDELMKPWTLKNWDTWEEEKPAWFIDKWIEAVPNHYIPYDWRVKYKKTKGRVEDPQTRRRSSLAQVKMLMGAEEER